MPTYKEIKRLAVKSGWLKQVRAKITPEEARKDLEELKQLFAENAEARAEGDR